MNLKRICTLLKKEANLVINDKSILMVLFLAPFLYLFLIGTTYKNKDEEKVSVGIVDMDHTQSSRQFLNKLNATQKIAITHTYLSVPEAEDGIARFEVQGVVHIPKGFEKNLKTKVQAPIGLVLNNTRFLPSNDINKTVNLVALDYALQSREDFFNSKQVDSYTAHINADPIHIQINPIYNSTYNYGDFLLPFLLFLILHQTLLIGLTESVASDREKHLMHEGFADSKQQFLTYILGKTGGYFFLFFAYALFVLFVAFPFFDLPIQGSIVAMLSGVILFLAATILYGWFIGSFFRSETNAMEVIAFTSYPVFLITGITWSIDKMPLFIQFIANALPLKPFFMLLKKLAVMGAEYPYYLGEITQLLLLFAIGYLAAYTRFRYLQKKRIKQSTRTDVPVAEH